MNAYLAGLLYGDGTRNKGKNRAFAVWIDQNNKNKSIVEEATKKFREHGLNVHQYGFLDKTRSLVYSKKFYIEFGDLRKGPIDFFIKLAKLDKWKFVSGFFDAEGTVTDRIVIYNGNREFLEVVSNFLKSEGICCHIYKFGKIYGIQVYKRASIETLKKKLCGIKLKKIYSLKLTNIADC
jgi:hypothetical protein